MQNELLNLTDEIIMDLEKMFVMLNYVMEREENAPEIYVPLNYVKNSLKNIDKINTNIQNLAVKELL